VKVKDVLNAYITAPIKKKVWTVLGPDFGQEAGKEAIIVRALYGLKKCVGWRRMRHYCGRAKSATPRANRTLDALSLQNST
jgi:hypothetical protein